MYIRRGGYLWVQHAYSDPETARQSGCRNSFVLRSKEVEIFRRGEEIVLREKDDDMAKAFDLLANLPDDLEVPGRDRDTPQKRKGL